MLELKKKDKLEIKQQKKQQIEYELIGSIQPLPNHFIFEINEETGEVKKADYEVVETVVFNWNETKIPKKLMINDNCIYIPAMNKENAIKKYNKNKNQSHYYTTLQNRIEF
jgi:hypothetical protein